MILTVTYDSIWCICRCFIRRPELFTLDEHMGSPPAFVGSVLLICLVFSIAYFVFFVFTMCLLCSMLLVLLDCIFAWPLWFFLKFINIPLSTILLDGFDIIAVELVVIIDVVGLTVDVVGLSVDVNAIDMKMDKQWCTKHNTYTIVWDIKTHLKTRGELRCSGWVSGGGTRCKMLLFCPTH